MNDRPVTLPESRCVWFDTEFVEDGKTIELLSIGLVRADGDTYYAEPAETDRSRASKWVVENVLPHLQGPVKPRAVIAAEIVAFVGDQPEFWAYYADYDWVALCQLYGTMMDLPKGWPMFCCDLKQLAGKTRLPEQTSTEHHALSDALWTRDAWRAAQSAQPGAMQDEHCNNPSEHACADAVFAAYDAALAASVRTASSPVVMGRTTQWFACPHCQQSIDPPAAPSATREEAQPCLSYTLSPRGGLSVRYDGDPARREELESLLESTMEPRAPRDMGQPEAPAAREAVGEVMCRDDDDLWLVRQKKEGSLIGVKLLYADPTPHHEASSREQALPAIRSELDERVWPAIQQWADDETMSPEDRVAAVDSAIHHEMDRYARAALALVPQAPLPSTSAEDVRDAVISEIAAERQRQINVEGWTPMHDDEHDEGEMAAAAGCYAFASALPPSDHKPEPWPWSRDWWKPGTPRRMLIKAGALIVAEIERLDRAALAAQPPKAPSES